MPIVISTTNTCHGIFTSVYIHSIIPCWDFSHLSLFMPFGLPVSFFLLLFIGHILNSFELISNNGSKYEFNWILLPFSFWYAKWMRSKKMNTIKIKQNMFNCHQISRTKQWMAATGEINEKNEFKSQARKKKTHTHILHTVNREQVNEEHGRRVPKALFH